MTEQVQIILTLRDKKLHEIGVIGNHEQYCPYKLCELFEMAFDMCWNEFEKEVSKEFREETKKMFDTLSQRSTQEKIFDVLNREKREKKAKAKKRFLRVPKKKKKTI